MSEQYGVKVFFSSDRRTSVKEYFKSMRPSGKIHNKPRLYFEENSYNPITGKAFISFTYINLKVLKDFFGEL